MKKDLFIDTNIAKNLSNPLDEEYRKLVKWLYYYDPNDTANKDNYAHLVVSKKLLIEYTKTATRFYNDIIAELQKEGRLITISNQEIKDFQQEHFTKTVEKKLQCNQEDKEHIPVVLLSDRKYALTNDNKFKSDLENFSGFTVRVEKRPELLEYKD